MAVNIIKDRRVTKRMILTDIARLFDPLGLGPVITSAKILLQNLWIWRIGWNDSMAANIQNSWLLFSEKDNLVLHGFSECSKSRVSPLKVLSLPRLELCGAVLLIRLMNKVLTSLNVKVHGQVYWTDSQIVLAWIGSPAKRWNTFVANRVGEIQSSSSPSEWHYVKSRDNPVDLISRGATLEQLKNSDLWWEGPGWLRIGNNFQEKEQSKIEIDGVPEERKRALVCLNRI